MSGLASVFPPPPPYFRRYTEEAWSAHKEDSTQHPELAPPPPPMAADPPQQSYRNFGSIWNVSEQLPSLADSGIEQLYEPGCDERASTLVPELKRLLHETLKTFLALLRTLGDAPEDFPAKVERLRTLFINMHHLLNTYRPVQSRESLLLKMRDQIAAAQATARSMRETNARITTEIDALEARLPRLATTEGRDPAVPENTVWEGLDLDADLREADNEGAVE